MKNKLAKFGLGLLFFVMVLGMSLFFFQMFLAFYEILND